MASTKNEFEGWFSTGITARRLDVSVHWVRHWAEDETLRALRTPIGWIFDPEDVERLATERAERKTTAPV